MAQSQLSPKFLKPFDVFMRGRKRAASELQDSSSSVIVNDTDYSPLKCLSSNNNNNNSNNNNSNSPARISAATQIRRRISLTPVKTGSPSSKNNNISIESSEIGSEDQENNPCNKNITTITTAKTNEGIKRQLNFGGIFPSSPPPSSSTAKNNTSSPGKMSKGTTTSGTKTPTSGRREKRKRKSDINASSPAAAAASSSSSTATTTSATTTTTTIDSKQKTILAMFKPIKAAVDVNAISHKNPKSITSAKLPIDWSLKTRLRITCRNCSVRIFRGSFKASEEATGVTSFVRCLNNRSSDGHDDDGSSGGGVANLASGKNGLHGCGGDAVMCGSSQSSLSSTNPCMDTSAAAILRQNTLVWTFPSIASLQPLFPRSGPQVNSSSSSTGGGFSGSLSNAALEAFEQEFASALRSLTHLCKTRQCPFFYVSAATFTCLFRAAGVGGIHDVLHVMITPTTSGFRKLLTDESIGFESLFEKQQQQRKRCPNTTSTSEVTKNNNDVVTNSDDIITLDDEDDDVDDTDSILSELGLSQQDFPSLQSNGGKSKKGKSKSKNFGSTTTSTSRSASAAATHFTDTSMILITGSDVQPLVNLLCDKVSKIGSAKTGRLAAIPPTILAPVAFIGATLTPLKIKSTCDKQGMSMTAGTANNKTTTLIETIDIIGPILPTHVSALVQQFRSSSSSTLTSASVPTNEAEIITTTTTSTTINLVTEESTSPFANIYSLLNAESSGDHNVTTTNDQTNASSIDAGFLFLQKSLSDSGVAETFITDSCSAHHQSKKPLKEVFFASNQKEFLSYV